MPGLRAPGGSFAAALTSRPAKQRRSAPIIGRSSGAAAACCARRLNPNLPVEALEDAFRKLTRPEGAELSAETAPSIGCWSRASLSNTARQDGSSRAQVRLIDFDDAAANDWLAVNQFTVVEGKHNRRPDIVLFVNGLPLAVIELKNAADENATIWSACEQLQTYKSEIPSLFHYQRGARRLRRDRGADRLARRRARMVQAVADDRGRGIGRAAHAGDAGRHRRRIRAAAVSRTGPPFHRLRGRWRRALVKKIAGYHQFHAVRVAVDETLRAAELQREMGGLAEEAGLYERAASRAASPATGASASSGTRRDRARA